MRTRILITGAAGQLGVELQRCAPEGIELIALDRRKLDIGNAQAVHAAFTAARPTWVVNAAAWTRVDDAEIQTVAAHKINGDGARNVAAAAQQVWARLLHVSTNFVFDGTQAAPYKPDDKPNPLSVYGASKLAGELAVRQATAGEAILVRTGWVYAAHGTNFVRAILHLLQERSEVPVVADQIGTPTAAASLARALWRTMASDIESGSTLHYTDEGVASWYDFAVAVREFAMQALGRELPPVVPVSTQDFPRPAKRPPNGVLDRSGSRALLGVGQHWREPLREVVFALLQQGKK